MRNLAHEIYSFDEFRLDLTRGSLFRGEEELKLRPQSFNVLKFLTENHGRLVSKDELIDAVWHETAVTDDSLVQCLKDIRNALGDYSQSIIRTVHRRGYIFEKEVEGTGSKLFTEETTDVRLIIEEASTPLSKVAAILNAMGRHKFITSISLLTMALTALAAFGILVVLRGSAGVPFSMVSPRRLTSDGNVKTAAVSPDGNLVAYVVAAAGFESLWVRQVVAPNAKEIISPAKAEYGGLTFSPDGNFVNYVESGVLFQVPTWGGLARRLFASVNSKITYSPDGKRIAFVRMGDGQGSRLMLANADGTGEPELLAARDISHAFQTHGCSWSPDGKTIVCPANEGGAGFGTRYPVGVQVAGGQQTVLTSRPWDVVGQLAWLPDGNEFVMSADGQFWQVSFPAGVPTPIYADPNVYEDVSMTADGKKMVSVQREAHFNINAIDTTDNSGRITQITTRTIGIDGWEGITTTYDNKVVYYSETDESPEIWIMNSDGSDKRQITSDKLMKSHFTVSPNGRQIVYGLVGEGIWKIDIDGNNRIQLAESGMMPFYSSDGQWIFYSLPVDRWTMWKVPSIGGEPVRVTNTPSIQPAVSPDGRRIAFMEIRPRLGTKKLKVIKMENGELESEIDVGGLRPFFNIEWVPDGSAVTYNAIENGLEGIVKQPINGEPREVLIAAKSDTESIGAFAWSSDGKRLFFSSGPAYRNVAMFEFTK